VDDPESRFTALYDAHYRGVLGYALTKAEPGTAEDVVSEVFLLDVLVLTMWQGLTPEDAADVAGCSTATFRVRQHRARHRLAKALDAANRTRPSTRSVPVARETTR
jgi:RNA polymerase sigma-70 factor (ECF subfamily)